MKTLNAIISLTSWKARINTVSKTLFNLISICNGFHIVLVLSEEEFPLKEKELPDDLNQIVKNKLVEILWIKKNYKAFKKWIFTSEKYSENPIITADDDCIYTYNYAKELYDEWLENKNSIITYIAGIPGEKFAIRGCATLYPPGIYNQFKSRLTKEIIDIGIDDPFYSLIVDRVNIQIKRINKDIRFYVKTHDNVNPLSNSYLSNIYNVYSRMLKNES